MLGDASMAIAALIRRFEAADDEAVRIGAIVEQLRALADKRGTEQLTEAVAIIRQAVILLLATLAVEAREEGQDLASFIDEFERGLMTLEADGPGGLGEPDV